jgi:hypothetical protein
MPNDLLEQSRFPFIGHAAPVHGPLNSRISPWYQQGERQQSFEAQTCQASFFDLVGDFGQVKPNRNRFGGKDLRVTISVARAGEEMLTSFPQVASAVSWVVLWPLAVAKFSWGDLSQEEITLPAPLEYARLLIPTFGQRISGRKYLESLVAQQVLIPHREEVGAYLDSHPDLGEILPAISAHARQEFGTQAELTLRVYRDPEINDCYLSLYVRLPSYDEAIMARLDRVSQPFEDELCQASGYLLVTTDFRPPRAKHGV